MNVEIVFDRTAEIVGMIEKAVGKRGKVVAEAVANDMREQMRLGKKTGRFYNRKPRGAYQASAPGEAPAVVSGELVESIEVQEVEGEGLEVVVKGDLAHTMEFGTAGGKIAPRPFATPAAEAAARTLPNEMAEAVRSVTG